MSPTILVDSITSIPDKDGLAYRSATIRTRIEQKHTQGNAVRIRCVSVVPGIAAPPQTVSQTAMVRAHTSTQVNNEKLHWPDDGNKVRLEINLALICTVIVYVLI